MMGKIIMDAKVKAILDRIRGLEKSISIGHEYLETGKHANWSGFRPLFTQKERNGKAMPPHRDWVRNVFLPRREKALGQAQKTLERLVQKSKRREDKITGHGQMADQNQ